MSYNEIPNIVVDSVTLSNKPLSNLEIIDAAKRLSVNGFREVFLRDISYKNNIKQMWCFKFRFIFWCWYTLGDVVQERSGMFYFDSDGVQPPSEQILYLKPSIFYNNERVKQNCEVFTVIYVSSH